MNTSSIFGRQLRSLQVLKLIEKGENQMGIKLKKYCENARDCFRRESFIYFSGVSEEFFISCSSYDEESSEDIDYDRNYDMASIYMDNMVYRCLGRDSEEDATEAFEGLIRDIYKMDQEVLKGRTFNGHDIFRMLVDTLDNMPGLRYDGYWLGYGIKDFMRAFLSLSRNGRVEDLIPCVAICSNICSVCKNTVGGDNLLPLNVEYMADVLKNNIKLLVGDLKECMVECDGCSMSGYDCVVKQWVAIEDFTDIKLEVE